jgi:hypothetical protein
VGVACKNGVFPRFLVTEDDSTWAFATTLVPQRTLWSWAYLTKTVRKPHRGEVNFKLRSPHGFCACFAKTSKTYFSAQTGCGGVIFSMQKPSQNRKTNFRRQAIQQGLFFLWLMQILKVAAMGVVAVCGIFLVRWAQLSHG